MYFFDTYAIIELILANPKYEPYADQGWIVSPLNVSELYLFFVRKYGRETADSKLSGYNFKILPISQNIAVESAKYKLSRSKEKLSWADCIGYTLANHHSLKFLTGDAQFENHQSVEFVK